MDDLANDNNDTPIDFIYEDADVHSVEISELYSYTEESDILSNRSSFEELMADRGLPRRWTDMSNEERSRVLDLIANGIECTKETFRWLCIRSLLYLMQGTFGECYSIQQQEVNARKNTLCIYKYGFYPSVLQLLLWELDSPPPQGKNLPNGGSNQQQANQPGTTNNPTNNNNVTNAANNAKSNITLGDSYKLRTLLSIVYTFVEILRVSDDTDTEEDQSLRATFKQELSQPVSVSIGTSQTSTMSRLFGIKAGSSPNYELLPVILFEAITRFSNGISPHYPIKKLLLLLWKVLLVTLGGSDELRRLKAVYREEAGLPPVPDDTLEVVKNMRPVSPPLITNCNDGGDGEQRRFNKSLKRSMFVKQSSVIAGESEETCLLEPTDGANGDDECMPDEGAVADGKESNGDGKGDIDEDEGIDLPLVPPSGDLNDSVIESDPVASDAGEGPADTLNGSEERPSSPRPSTPNPSSLKSFSFEAVKKKEEEEKVQEVKFNKGLPWVSKVRNKDMDAFFDYTRSKFIGYTLPLDRTTTAGFPEPILEGIEILRSHIYVSLSEIQIRREDDLMKYPLTMSEDHLFSLESPVEALYSAMLPSLSQYMISLLKILLAASRAKTESINITSDVIPDAIPSPLLGANGTAGTSTDETVEIENVKLAIDINRHKELMIKAISGILLLLLKHYKINHTYQFEYISQQLMFANCIPLVLKFFNQSISQFVRIHNNITFIDFPACVIGEQPELTAIDLLYTNNRSSYSWRNVFSCINLLRILNKLTKWKHSRIMMLVVFKSAPILRKALRVRNAMLQLYVLKLLKMQAKYLGRQWRKSNTKIMSAIYQKVRHRMTDDWAYGNDIDSRPWDFQAEEFSLQANINRFHNRRYGPKNVTNVTSSDPESLIASDLNTTVDTNLLSVLSSARDIELSSNFRRNYSQWLDREVFQTQTDWDHFLVSTNTTCNDM